MGQKCNTTILRLGVKNNEWESKYLEKNFEESSLYVLNILEIEKYLNQTLKLYGMILNNCQINYSNTTLTLYISYYKTVKSLSLINKINKTQKIQILQKENFFSESLKQQKLPKKRFKALKLVKTIKHKKKYFNLKKFFFNNFTESIIEHLTIFTKKKINISIIFQNLNKGLSLRLNNFQSNLFKNIIIDLRQFSHNNKFFKDTINIILIAIRQKKTSKLLAEFISFQITVLEKSRKHRFFFYFLKRTLKLFIISKLSRIKGIKIVIKGRINKSKRTKNYFIQLGSIPLQTLNSHINYSQTISYTKTGTFGIKVWICEKNLL